MNIRVSKLLKAILNAFLGTTGGVIAGAGLSALFAITHPYNKAIGSQDVQAMALGLTIITMMVIGGLLGFFVETETALVLDYRAGTRTQFPQ